MATLCGTGSAGDADTDRAVRDALERAASRLAGRAPDVGLIFASPVHDLGRVLRAAETGVPGVDWLCCSSAGELTEAGATTGAVCAMLLSWGDAKHQMSEAEPLDDVLAQARRISGHSGWNAGEADGLGWSGSTTLMLGDGLSPRFEQVVAGVRRLTGVNHQVVGGGAADDGALETTWVATAGKTLEGGVAALHVASRAPWGLGIGHGVVAKTERMSVTRAEGNVVYEIDGRPAVEVFADYAEKQGHTFDASEPGAYLVQNELGIYFFDEIVGVRAGLAIGPDGGIVYAGEVPEESSVAIVRGDPERLIAAAAVAAQQAKDEVEGEVAGVLVFSCVTRKMVLGDRYPEELRAIIEVLGPDVPLAGYASYGEIAKVRGKLGGYHNHTIVIAAIPA